MPLTWLLLRDVGDIGFGVDQPTDPDQQIAFTASALSAAGVQVVVTLVATLLLTGILTVVVSRAVLGQRIGAGAAWAQARPRIPALLAVTALVFLAVLGVLLAALVPGILLALLDAPVAAVVVAFVLGVPLAVALAVYLYVAFALAPAAIVLERQPVIGLPAPVARARQGRVVAHLRHPAAGQRHRAVPGGHPQRAVHRADGRRGVPRPPAGTTSTPTRSCRCS